MDAGAAKMSKQSSWKSDALCLGLVAGLCLLIGVQQVRKRPIVNPDGVFYIEQAQKLPGGYQEVARTYPMGYPFALWAGHKVALAWAGDDSSMLWLRSSQGVTILCRILALVPLYFLGKLLVGRKHTFWALLILIVLPYPAQYGAEVLREWPHVLFLSLGLSVLYSGLPSQRWWVPALVGLDAGVAYLVRPESVQLLLYACAGLVSVWWSAGRARPLRLVGAGAALAAGFLVTCSPHVFATGTLRPSKFQQYPFDTPPVIQAVGPQAASDEPLEFDVAAGELLELPIGATDPDGDPLTFSLVSVPAGSRPVYQFWSMFFGSHFWTIRAEEKTNLLRNYAGEEWEYEGIACYAYAKADACPGLQAVHRFWSSPRLQHFYTRDEREKERLLQEAPGTWTYEGVAFYAFGADSRAGDTAPVCRLTSPQDRYFWEVQAGRLEVPLGREEPRGTIVWRVPATSAPPAGARIENGVLRWRPDAREKGDYQFNIIVSSNGLQSCQLLRVKVTEAAGRDWGRGPVLPCLAQVAGPETLSKAVDKMFDGIVEDLMVIFFVPWLLGLGWRLRHPAHPLERVLIVAVVLVNTALMFWRHVEVASGDDRRYGLALVALTIFYVPVGVEVMSRWLGRVPRPRWMSATLQRSLWFHSLVAVGLLGCLPKLLLASPGNKIGYETAAAWLRHHTPGDAVLAVPDERISFYAGRQGLLYVRYPNMRRADYVVTITDNDEGQVPQGWRREYSVAVDRRSKKTLVIYSTGRPRPLGGGNSESETRNSKQIQNPKPK
jgi:hypothetical protein